MAGCVLGFSLILISASITHGDVGRMALTQQVATASLATESGLLETFLRQYFKSDVDTAARYVAAFVDLNGDTAKDVIVYVLHPGYCGSGGCVTLVLEREKFSYKVVTKITITQTPIRVLSSTSNGWRTLSVWVQGGGIQPGYEAELRFDGKAYPSNPSVPPARRLEEEVTGEVVISSSQEKDARPLFP